jgi:hypothetical protein
MPGAKAAGAWRWPPSPSNAEVKERAELYICSPSWVCMTSYRENFTLTGNGAVESKRVCWTCAMLVIKASSWVCMSVCSICCWDRSVSECLHFGFCFFRHVQDVCFASCLFCLLARSPRVRRQQVFQKRRCASTRLYVATSQNTVSVMSKFLLRIGYFLPR